MRPHIVRFQRIPESEDPENPLSTVTGMNKHGLAVPCLVQHYNTGGATSVDAPLPTVTTRDRHGLATPALLQVNHGNGEQTDESRRVKSPDDPLWALTANPSIGLARPVLVQTAQTGGNGGYARSVEQPAPTLTTRNDIGIATPEASPVENGPEITENEIDPRRLVLVNGHTFLLDIRFRMLQNGELARAMGFDDEETTYEFVGTRTEVTRQVGNAVPVNLAAALVKAALS